MMNIKTLSPEERKQRALEEKQSQRKKNKRYVRLFSLLFICLSLVIIGSIFASVTTARAASAQGNVAQQALDETPTPVVTEPAESTPPPRPNETPVVQPTPGGIDDPGNSDNGSGAISPGNKWGDPHNFCVDPNTGAKLCDENSGTGFGKVRNPGVEGLSMIYFTLPEQTIENTAVRQMWGIVMGIANLGIGIIFALYGVRVILGNSVFRWSEAIEVIPRAILMILMMNLTMQICALFLHLVNNLSLEMMTWIDKNNNYSFAPYVMQDDKGVTIDKMPQISNFNVGIADFMSIAAAIQSMSNLMNFVIQLAALSIMVQTFVRIFMINVLIIVSPIAVGCGAIPGQSGQSVTRMWFKNFLATVFEQFMQVMAMIVTEALLTPIAHIMFIGMSDKITSVLMQEVTQLMFFWFIARVPGLLGSVSVNTIIETGQMVQQSAMNMTNMAYNADLTAKMKDLSEKGLWIQGVSTVASLV